MVKQRNIITLVVVIIGLLVLSQQGFLSSLTTQSFSGIPNTAHHGGLEWTCFSGTEAGTGAGGYLINLTCSDTTSTENYTNYYRRFPMRLDCIPINGDCPPTRQLGIEKNNDLRSVSSIAVKAASYTSPYGYPGCNENVTYYTNTSFGITDGTVFIPFWELHKNCWNSGYVDYHRTEQHVSLLNGTLWRDLEKSGDGIIYQTQDVDFAELDPNKEHHLYYEMGASAHANGPTSFAYLYDDVAVVYNITLNNTITYVNVTPPPPIIINPPVPPIIPPQCKYGISLVNYKYPIMVILALVLIGVLAYQGKFKRMQLSAALWVDKEGFIFGAIGGAIVAFLVICDLTSADTWPIVITALNGGLFGAIVDGLWKPKQ